MATIAERMNEALLLRDMKQADLVEKTGIGKSSISTYLSGLYEPKQKNIYKIAKALDVNESWLMGYDVPMERKQTIQNISPELLKNEKELDNILLSAVKELLSHYVEDKNNDIQSVVEMIDQNSSDYKFKSEIYNALFKQLIYNKDDSILDLFPYVYSKRTYTAKEISLIEKYKLIDDKGKHTVDTVLEMEYNRCSNDVLNAANERPGATAEDKAHDDAIMNDENF